MTRSRCLGSTFGSLGTNGTPGAHRHGHRAARARNLQVERSPARRTRRYPRYDHRRARRSQTNMLTVYKHKGRKRALEERSLIRAAACTSPRPSERELAVIEQLIELMRQNNILGARRRPPNVSTVACALAVHRREFSLADAKDRFGLDKKLNINKWLNCITQLESNSLHAYAVTVAQLESPSQPPSESSSQPPSQRTRATILDEISAARVVLDSLTRELHATPSTALTLRDMRHNRQLMRLVQQCSTHINVHADPKLHGREEFVGKPGGSLVETVCTLARALRPLAASSTVTIGLVDLELCKVDVKLNWQGAGSPREHTCSGCQVARDYICPCAECANDEKVMSLMMSSCHAVVLHTQPWDGDGHGILACVPSLAICEAASSASSLAEEGIEWAERLRDGEDNVTLQGMRWTGGEDYDPCRATGQMSRKGSGLEKNQDVGLQNDMAMVIRPDWAATAGSEAVQKAAAKGGSPEQVLSVPPELFRAGAAVDVRQTYLQHRQLALERGGAWAHLKAKDAPELRIGPKVNEGSTVRVPAWRNGGIIDPASEWRAEFEGAAQFSATVQAGTESLLHHFAALPMVHRLQRRKQVIIFARQCMELDAVAAVEAEENQRRLQGTAALTDDERVRLYLQHAPPFTQADEYLLGKNSNGMGSSTSGTKKAHDDKNAARHVTAHRTLTEPLSGARVALEVCMNGVVVQIPSRQRQLILWYAWLPHRTLVVEPGPPRAATRGAKPTPPQMNENERLHASCYDRLAFERFLEVAEHAWQMCGGVPTAGALVRALPWS